VSLNRANALIEITHASMLFQERLQRRIRDFTRIVRDRRCCDHGDDLQHVFFFKTGF
jgi:hypothetical protein